MRATVLILSMMSFFPLHAKTAEHAAEVQAALDSLK